MAELDLSPELRAMAGVESALKNMPEEVQQRVLRWACERFKFLGPSVGLKSIPASQQVGVAADEEPAETAEASGADAEELAEFYDRANPQSDADKALVAAYWYQAHEGENEIEALRINKELKHLGHRVGNISRAFEMLKASKPALVVQLRKEGSTRQARKKFKVTSEGKKAVERMLAKRAE